MITEQQEETASLYVLGLLMDEDRRAFEAELKDDAALQSLVASLNNATVAIARTARSIPPPSSVWERLQQGMGLTTEKPRASAKRSILTFIPYLATAAVLVFSFIQFQQQRDALKASRDQAELAEAKAGKLGDQLRTAVSETDAWKLKQSEAEALVKSWQSQAETARNEASSLMQARDDLQQKLLALEQSNAIDKTRIAVLGSLLKNQPKAVAVSVWNQERQNGVLVVENLPVLAAGKDYQLWVLDPTAGAPVSAGVFKVDAKGNVRITFKPSKEIGQADKFAVTEEKEGGVESPTMNKMVVIGG